MWRSPPSGFEHMHLRPATDLDAPFFWAIRNDPQTITNSWSKRAITEGEHARWWGQTHDTRYVAEGAGGEPVGIVRLTALDDSTCEVHLAVAPGARGLGYSVDMLREATDVAKGLGYELIIARVDAPNTPSLRAFLRAGYDIASPGTLLLERSLKRPHLPL